MWPAWTSTATPSGIGHPVTRAVLPEPSGLTENSRPPPLASSTNSFPVRVMISPFIRYACQLFWHAKWSIPLHWMMRRDAGVRDVTVAGHQCVTRDTEGYRCHCRHHIHHAQHRYLFTYQRF